MNKAIDWISTEVAAGLVGVTRFEMVRKFRKKIIPAERFGKGPWKVDRAEIEKYLKNPISPGNPGTKRKPKTTEKKT